MLNLIVDTKKAGSQFLATDGENWSVIPNQKVLIYKSDFLNSLGYYDKIPENLAFAKNLFLKNFERQEKLIYGNSAFLSYKQGLYSDIIYFDFKHFYPQVFKLIANHIDENYFGKEIKGIVKRKQFFANSNIPFSKSAKKAKLVSIDDIAKNSIAIDKNDKSQFIEEVEKINNNQIWKDEADKLVAKITRNAMAYGFGYQQKIARINNISALVMFFARKIMEYSIKALQRRGYEVIFSHTDSFMLGHINTKDLDEAIKEACENVNIEYFNGIDIIHLDLNNISIKQKFDDIIIANQNAYLYSISAPRGKHIVELAIAGFHTLRQNGLGIAKDNTNIQDFLNEHYNELFPIDKEFFLKYGSKEFLYSTLKYRLDEAYTKKILDMWFKGEDLSDKAVISSPTIMLLYNTIGGVFAKN